MWFQYSILVILFNIIFASPPGSRDGANEKNNQKNWNSGDDKKNQPSTSSSHLSKYSYGSQSQSMPLDLSIRNRQFIQYAPPSTSGMNVICSDCRKSFNSHSALSYHQQSYHRAISFDCTKCGQKYTTKQRLENHDKSVHQGITYDCAKCGKKYTRKDQLEIHDRAQHRGMTFDCTKCGRKYVTKQSLENHDRSEHQGNREIYKCDKCPFQTKHKGSMDSHKSRPH